MDGYGMKDPGEGIDAMRPGLQKELSKLTGVTDRLEKQVMMMGERLSQLLPLELESSHDGYGEKADSMSPDSQFVQLLTRETARIQVMTTQIASLMERVQV